MDKIRDMLTGAAGNIVTAIIVAVVGFFVIKFITKALGKQKFFDKMDKTTVSFILNAVKWLPRITSGSPFPTAAS